MRPGFGVLGSKTICTVNYFELSIPDCLIYQYDVVIKKVDTKNPNKVIDSIHGPTNRKVIEELRSKHLGSLAKNESEALKISVYDGQAGLYSPKLFEKVTADIEILDDGK